MAKKSATLKDKTVEDLKRLSTSSRKEAEDFIAYLRAKEELDATREVIRDKDFVNSIMKGDEDFKAGRFKSWKVVKEDV